MTASLRLQSLLASRDAIATRALTSETLIRATLDAVSRLDPQLNSYICVDEAGALARARQLDQQRDTSSRADLLLDGVPIGVKDLFVTRDLPTTCASAMLEGYRSPFESAVTERLRDAGAVIIGKHNMDAFAMGSHTTFSVAGPTHNPWDLAHSAGGSSGGSAAAVAAGLCAAAVGSDTGGSVRQPAAHCGVVGLKPTYGRFSRYGMVAFASSLDQAGVLTRTVADAAVMLDALSGHDPRDATSAQLPPSNALATLTDSITGITLGVLHLDEAHTPSDEVADALDYARGCLNDEGATCREVALPSLQHAVSMYCLISMAEAASNLARYDGVRFGCCDLSANDLSTRYQRSRGDGFGLEVKRRLLLGAYITSEGYASAYYERALAARAWLRNDLARLFRSCDVLLLPTTPTSAPRRDGRERKPLQNYLDDVFTIPANLAGLPALSVPVGLSPQGRPVAVQLMAPPFHDATLLRVAAALARARGPFPSPPMAEEV